MRDDTLREFLESVREARLEYQRLNEKIASLEAACTKTTSAPSDGAGCGGDADTQRLWTLYAHEHGRLAGMLEHAQLQEHKVEAFVSSLKNPVHRLLLKLRYVDCLPWDRVQLLLNSADVYYSERHVYRMHGEALEAARARWNEIEKEKNNEQ